MQKGFTLIEIIISIFIISIAIVGVYGAFSIMVILTTNASDRLTAAYLAQEGIEIVRNIRDTNWLIGEPFNAYLADNNANCEAGCEAEYTSSPYQGINLLSQWASGINNDPGGVYLNIDANNFYSYSTAGAVTPTNFKRKITITCLPDLADCQNATAIKVISQVYWKEKPSILSSSVTYPFVKVEEILYDWY